MRNFFNPLKSNQKILTLDGYFPNKNKGCGITSLSNLIYLKYNDFNTAMRVYVNSRTHPLVSEDGTTDISSFPILLEELSRNKYSGVCYLNPSLDYNLDNLQLKSSYLNLLKRTFETSLERKLIIIERNYPLNYPNILFLMTIILFLQISLIIQHIVCYFIPDLYMILSQLITIFQKKYLTMEIIFPLHR